MHYTKIIHNVREKTDTVILFHSGTGKDSIMLLDLCSKSFKKVICVFMYIVKDLDYENRYINWALKKYTNVEFILGEIENLPLSDSSADVIISNCVVNLSPNKEAVFRFIT